METPRVELDSTDLVGCERALPDLVGSLVRFSNGVVIVLQDEAGCFWGDDPYGNMFGVEVSASWVQCLMKTVEYWNAPRDETGAMMHPDKETNDA